jgi:HSP20 family protein
MFIRWSSYDPSWAALESFRRRMDQVFEELNRGATSPSFYESRWPQVELRDLGDKLQLVAEVPGMSDKDIQVTLTQDVLSIAGERYTVHRKERGSMRFARSFTLPTHVDPEKVAATAKHGVLTIDLYKAPEAQPRQIAVKAS